ncbi:MAG: gfo/Idh/MocA family oxidoreductase [Spirochaetaceae bacterium]|nr:MAG: gfo/Idh/MocA family oxidoreductase [Spirochaetaceae bacterium]
MNPVKFGILGVSGHFIRRVVLPLRDSAKVSIAAIASRTREKAADAAGRFGIPVAYGSYQELVDDKKIEAVYIPLPNNLHLEWIKKCADAGKHILCEKPIAMNAEEAVLAADYAAKKQVLLMEAFMYKFHPQWVHVKELVDTGEIGQVHSVHTHFSYNNTDPANIRNKTETGGGALMDIGCYAVSFPRFILGREPSRVTALLSRDEAFGTDVLSSAILDFGSARATFTVATRSFPYQRCVINGSQGWMEIKIPCNIYSDVSAEVTITYGVGMRTYLTPPANQYVIQFEAFADAVRAGVPAPVSVQDAVANMKVIDALVKAAAENNWVKVG